MNRLNFSRLTVGFLITAVLLVLGGCNPQPKKEAEPEKMDQEVGEVEAPEGIISLDEAKELCQNYEIRRIPGIKNFEAAQTNAEGKFIPTQYVTFDLETIRQYLDYLEQEAKRANVVPDSLRIYLGNYGNKGKDPNRNTVFILPTAEIGKGYGGFYIDNEGQAKLIRNYWPKEGENGDRDGESKSKASFVPTFNASLMQSGGSLVMNRGSAGPPPFADF
ncbi:MAG: hypothetical protein AAGC45_10705 [Bacteroidota bacterium]